MAIIRGMGERIVTNCLRIAGSYSRADALYTNLYLVEYLYRTLFGLRTYYCYDPDWESRSRHWRYPLLRSKEEYYYFRIFVEHYGTGKAIETVGQWISL
jgi:hypothetical protein